MAPVTEIEAVKDSAKTHWVNRAPLGLRPYLQLSRLDRPVGYWLLALPGWIGLAFAGLSHGLAWTDLVWAALILIGAIAMRGAGCTYNDIVDQDLDAQVERTALRPLPAGTVTTRQAWKWTFAQIGVGFLVWLCLPLLAKGIALLALPLVAAYPFMKRITWFPQVWLGLTFNWAVLVAYVIKNGAVNIPIFILYTGLVFWTVGYDTIYACQDTEDDAMIGIKSTARRFGKTLRPAVAICFLITWICVIASAAMKQVPVGKEALEKAFTLRHYIHAPYISWIEVAALSLPLLIFFGWQVASLKRSDSQNSLHLFKVSAFAGVFIILIYLYFGFQTANLIAAERITPS